MNSALNKELIPNQTVKACLSYIGCLCITLFVTFFLNGTVGVLLTTALICASVLSAAITLIVRPKINASVKLNKTAAAKNENIQCIISLSKRIILPAPIIEIHMKYSGNLSAKSNIYHVTLAGTEINTAVFSDSTDHKHLLKLIPGKQIQLNNMGTQHHDAVLSEKREQLHSRELLFLQFPE